MKLLLIEDNLKLVQALSYQLKSNGYAVEVAPDGESGIELAATGIFDIIILDRMLPYRDGLSILREYRSLGFSTPVIILSAKDSPADRVEGLDSGADDYLVKPFSTEELLARLRALTRRRETQYVTSECVSACGLILDPLRCNLTIGPDSIQLTVKESQLLELLMVNFGQVVPTERILEKIWGSNAKKHVARVQIYIHFLRKKLKGCVIKTIHDVGYSLQQP